MIYIVTGKLGAGKSLLAVQQAINYASEGRRVATNFSIDFSPICKSPSSKLSKTSISVLPSMPSSQDLLALGIGGETEDTAGALILDECGAFLNSRTWSNSDRHDIITWLLHARKRRWDVFLIIQHERMLDKQIRDALAEYVVTVRRTDRMKVPFLPFKLPRLHMGIVRYGLEQNSFVADRWFTRGSEPMKCYNTHEIFSDIESGAYTQLSNFRLHAMYKSHETLKFDYSQLLIMPSLIPKLLIYSIVRLISPRSLVLLHRKRLNHPPTSIVAIR